MHVPACNTDNHIYVVIIMHCNIMVTSRCITLYMVPEDFDKSHVLKILGESEKTELRPRPVLGCGLFLYKIWCNAVLAYHLQLLEIFNRNSIHFA